MFFLFFVGIQNEQQPFQVPFGQQNYGKSAEVTNHQQAMGVRQEEAVFNPRGPGRGGGVISQPTPSYAPGRGNSCMNEMANDYSNVEGNIKVRFHIIMLCAYGVTIRKHYKTISK